MSDAKEKSRKFREPNKDRLVKIFSIDKITVNGETVTYKTFHYSSLCKSGLHAFVRYQSAAERISSGITSEALTLVVYINWRPNITINQYVEFQGKLYQIILPPDEYTMQHRELKLTCTSIAPFKYDKERYIES